MTCVSCAVMGFWYSKRIPTFSLHLKSPCQNPLCGVAYSCSYNPGTCVSVISWSFSQSFRIRSSRHLLQSHLLQQSHTPKNISWADPGWLSFCDKQNRWSQAMFLLYNVNALFWQKWIRNRRAAWCTVIPIHIEHADEQKDVTVNVLFSVKLQPGDVLISQWGKC